MSIGVKSALLRYRIIAWIVGVVLVTLVISTWPLDHWGHHNLVVLFWTTHGYLFLVYLILAFDLSRRAKWKIWQTLLVLVAGTIPFMSFVMEHYATTWTRQKIAATPTPAPVPHQGTPDATRPQSGSPHTD